MQTYTWFSRWYEGVFKYVSTASFKIPSNNFTLNLLKLFLSSIDKFSYVFFSINIIPSLDKLTVPLIAVSVGFKEITSFMCDDRLSIIAHFLFEKVLFYFV